MACDQSSGRFGGDLVGELWPLEAGRHPPGRDFQSGEYFRRPVPLLQIELDRSLAVRSTRLSSTRISFSGHERQV